MNRIARAFIWFYKILLSPIFGRTCRFYPTCSDYGLEAYKKHGFFAATRLVCSRLWRCRPGGGHGVDFVPDATNKNVKN